MYRLTVKENDETLALASHQIHIIFGASTQYLQTPLPEVLVDLRLKYLLMVLG